MRCVLLLKRKKKGRKKIFRPRSSLFKIELDLGREQAGLSTCYKNRHSANDGIYELIFFVNEGLLCRMDHLTLGASTQTSYQPPPDW